MKVTLEKLGITASYSRLRASHDNPICEALFRTGKYRSDWPTGGFASKADAQKWVQGFATCYNAEHLHCTRSAHYAEHAPQRVGRRDPCQADHALCKGPGVNRLRAGQVTCATGSPSRPYGAIPNAIKRPQI